MFFVAGLGVLALFFEEKSSALSSKSLRGQISEEIDFPRYYPYITDRIFSTSILYVVGLHRYKPNFWYRITPTAPQC